MKFILALDVSELTLSNLPASLAALLRDTADRLEAGQPFPIPINNSTGDTVGSVELIPDHIKVTGTLQ